MTKARILGIRVDDVLDRQLKAAAEKDRRNVSDFARLALIDAVSKKKSRSDEAAA